MQLENIPQELKRLRQWVAVHRDPDPKKDKRPLDPRTGRYADVTDPSTWGSFQEATSTGLAVGFVLTEEDPFCFIDLDKPDTEQQAERHSKILEALDSYAELSQSGNGVHIICRATIPKGVRRDKVEIYSSQRYMIMTGRVLNSRPISDQQQLVDMLFREMNSTAETQLEERSETLSDEDILDMAERAANSDKFKLLWGGDFSDWPSQSEADFALLSMLAFYSKSNEQVRRLFRESALGQRPKAQRDAYLDRCLRKIRAKELPPIDFSEALTKAEEVVEEEAAPQEAPTFELELPPGLVGEVAYYIETTAVRPVREVALAAALAYVAGVCGRSYNISDSGLSQYLILLAGTGSGKEGAATGIDRLVSAVRKTVPGADQFIGPGAFASGQALLRVLEKQPCFMSILGEFGLTLQNLCDVRANQATVMLKQLLLDLYGKSGFNKTLRPNVYSDSTKNTRLVQSPNITILGESTPEAFYDGLDQVQIQQGLIPRFLIIEYNGKRPSRNRNAGQLPSEELVESLATLNTIALTTQQNNTCQAVTLLAEAESLLDDFDAEIDEKMNGTGQEIEKQLWNRAHLKALKLAGLIAVGCDFHTPTVTPEVAQWAIDLVRRDVQTVVSRFATGEVGLGGHRQEADLRSSIAHYLQMKPAQRKHYKVGAKLLEEQVVPYHFLRRWLRLRASFKNDRRGCHVALQSMLDELVKADVLQVINPSVAFERWNVRSPIYIIGANW